MNSNVGTPEAARLLAQAAGHSWKRLYEVFVGWAQATAQVWMPEQVAPPVTGSAASMQADRRWHKPLARGGPDRRIVVRSLRSIRPRSNCAVPRFDVQRQDAALDGQIERIVGAARETVRLAGVAPERIEAVYFTGGSTPLPAVARRIAAPFVRAQAVYGDQFTSVVSGLAQAAPGALRLIPRLSAGTRCEDAARPPLGPRDPRGRPAATPARGRDRRRELADNPSPSNWCWSLCTSREYRGTIASKRPASQSAPPHGFDSACIRILGRRGIACRRDSFPHFASQSPAPPR